MLVAKWQRILAVRAAVQKELEAVRQSGAIGSSLQAEVAITAADAPTTKRWRRSATTCASSRSRRPRPCPSAMRLAMRVTPSPHPKCERCWHWRADVGADPAHPTLCGRCVANLFGAGEPRAVCVSE